ncbi:MAG: acyltransferase, partial [Flavobacteriaceae bacterium]|nr:acyltransferase [Flavobacteriaceae bacterium]
AFLITKIVYQLNYDEGDMFYWNVNLKSVVIYRIDSIYYGVLGAFFCNVYPKLWKELKIEWLDIAVLLLVLINIYISVFNNHIAADPFFWNIFALPLYSIIMMFMLPYFSEWKIAPDWLSKPVTTISVISYSMYLLHYSVILFFVKSLPYILGVHIPFYIQVFLYFILTLIGAYLCYKYYEKPMMDLRDKPFVTKYFKK